MRTHLDHHDAELLLQLYDLRREAKLRQARDWFMREFQADSIEEFYRRFPAGLPENAYFRMTVTYWEMAASIVARGLINEELFFENTAECWIVWEKIKALVPAWRDKRKNPHIWKNLEALAEKYDKWMAQRAPDALETLREQLLKTTQHPSGETLLENRQ